MKILAYLLNLGLLGLALFLVVENGLPQPGERDFLFFLLVVFAPLSALVSIFRDSKSNSDGFIALYLKRKTLEEKKKIETLSKN